jgi:uncharacterized protein YceK
MKRLSIVILIFLTSGCATIIQGPYQEIPVYSTPPGAIVTNTSYTAWVKTPGVLKLKRSEPTVLTARLFGYEDEKIKIKSSFSPLILGNAAGQFYPWLISKIYPGIAALMFDLSTGSPFELSPKECHFVMRPRVKKQ